MRQVAPAHLPLIGDDELWQHVNRLLSTRPSPKQSFGEPAAPGRPPRPSAEEFARFLSETSQLFHAVPDAILMVGPNGFSANARLAKALEEERRIFQRRKGSVLDESPLHEPGLAAIVRKVSGLGVERFFLPLGSTIFRIQSFHSPGDAWVIYGMPTLTWEAAHPLSIRLTLCLRLTGLALKQVADVLEISFRRAQYISRYYQDDLSELRLRLLTLLPQTDVET